ncbi:PREDICTED: leucine-rich repeat receptor protein kinase EXS-like [Fragaria vesca subsp. vesca]|uniref:leucine-rich repeat receptor protein kinase EXS-like n=1 Tax=Fragaria vesca subsp. vesca TaxID=101020 RepID=UPI0002C30C66|nr:PREDICTED: leucine-rich repeat receptor protein kinase EXS-like [Fragaria vesca subsp. vesca]
MSFVQENALEGNVPTVVFNMSSLITLTLFGNYLKGRLPDNMCQNLPRIQELYFSHNQLEGPLPSIYWHCKQLVNLRLGRNNFIGSIPKNIGNATELSQEVNVLSCLENLKMLRHLAFNTNPLNAYLPISFFRNLSTSLQDVYLYDCNLRGNVLDDVGNLSSLAVLSMYNNKLSGSIPASLGNLKNLQGLSLGSNELQGHIPDELCQLKYLAILGLHGNQLSGSIPSCLGHLVTALRYLFLHSNLLSSTIPSSLWGLTYILDLYLSSNNLSGSLSEDVGNLKVVIVIDLSNNHFSGSIPSNIGNLQTLQNLSLENNNFKGLIPSSLGKSLSVVLLDLSKNNLSGMIPKSLESLKYLKILDLSFNKLQGEIPTGGPLRNFSAQSFVSSGKLCGASRFHVPACKNSIFEAHSTNSSRSISKYIILGILSAMFIVSSVWIVILRRRNNVEAAEENELLSQLLWRVSHIELVRATNAFDERNLLGTGGFGSRLSIMINVASALEYLHHGYEPSIVHCDLKPSNILLDDEDMSAHVADFGIAKLLCGRDSMTQTITQATIGYMAPESPEKRVNMQDALATLNKIKIKFLKGATGGVVLNRSLV